MINKELGELDLIKVLKNLCVTSAVIEGYDEQGRKVTLYPDKSDMDKIKAALKRDESKKVSEIERDYTYFVCPNCFETIGYTNDVEEHKYCLNCGQTLDWSEEEW